MVASLFSGFHAYLRGFDFTLTEPARLARKQELAEFPNKHHYRSEVEAGRMGDENAGAVIDSFRVNSSKICDYCLSLQLRSLGHHTPLCFLQLAQRALHSGPIKTSFAPAWCQGSFSVVTSVFA